MKDPMVKKKPDADYIRLLSHLDCNIWIIAIKYIGVDQ